MNLRPLFVVILAVGSAVTGAVFAAKTHLPSAPMTSAESSMPTSQTEELPLSAPVVVSDQSLEQASTPVASTPDEFDQLWMQLRRAVQERNPMLLRSLMRASSLREALRSVEAAESMNFENLDHSTWTMLEKAINYHCRLPIDGMSPRNCAEQQPSPSPQ